MQVFFRTSDSNTGLAAMKKATADRTPPTQNTQKRVPTATREEADSPPPSQWSACRCTSPCVSGSPSAFALSELCQGWPKELPSPPVDAFSAAMPAISSIVKAMAMAAAENTTRRRQKRMVVTEGGVGRGILST